MRQRDNDILDEPRTILLFGEINDDSAKDIIEQILYLSMIDKTDITLFINTEGGAIHSAFSIYTVMKSCGVNVNTVGLGRVFSSGMLILAAGKTRTISKTTRMMYHAASFDIAGDMKQAKNELQESCTLEALFDECFANEIGTSVVDVVNLYTTQSGGSIDRYINAEEAIKLKIADKII